MKVLSKLQKTQSISKAQGSQVVEYAILIGLVAVPAAWGLSILGRELQTFFTSIAQYVGQLPDFFGY
ncbi:MAG: hypothetical protein A3J38_00840 [Gammaproteobacteria bacterium RIFCSPHIGHO2_12_FULL_45_9]|nr:MAG: hypothetical protein A3J38_00840 [Gammaproteobacteria bacterium RIFCSPHIGHO2_12_FULL_45_9]